MNSPDFIGTKIADTSKKTLSSLGKNPKVGRVALGAVALLTVAVGGYVAKTLWNGQAQPRPIIGLNLPMCDISEAPSFNSTQTNTTGNFISPTQTNTTLGNFTSVNTTNLQDNTTNSSYVSNPLFSFQNLGLTGSHFNTSFVNGTECQADPIAIAVNTTLSSEENSTAVKANSNSSEAVADHGAALSNVSQVTLVTCDTQEFVNTSNVTKQFNKTFETSTLNDRPGARPLENLDFSDHFFELDFTGVPASLEVKSSSVNSTQTNEICKKIEEGREYSLADFSSSFPRLSDILFDEIISGKFDGVQISTLKEKFPIPPRQLKSDSARIDFYDNQIRGNEKEKGISAAGFKALELLGEDSCWSIAYATCGTRHSARIFTRTRTSEKGHRSAERMDWWRYTNEEGLTCKQLAEKYKSCKKMIEKSGMPNEEVNAYGAFVASLPTEPLRFAAIDIGLCLTNPVKCIENSVSKPEAFAAPEAFLWTVSSVTIGLAKKVIDVCRTPIVKTVVENIAPHADQLANGAIIFKKGMDLTGLTPKQVKNYRRWARLLKDMPDLV